jgi:uncharacterized protein YgiM (DUF1202 family)
MQLKFNIHLMVLCTILLMLVMPRTSVAAQCTPRADWTSSYTIAKGDTLNRIARRYGLTAQQVAQGNCIANLNRIYVGQTLRVPTANHGNSGNNGNHGTSTVRTIDAEIWVYGAPNPHSQVRTIIRGETVTLFYRSEDGAWVYIRTSGQDYGWIQTYQLTDNRPTARLPINNTPEDAGQAQINDTGVRLRAGPGTHTRVLAQLSYERVFLLGRSHDGSWVKVRTVDQRVGWVYGQYLQVTSGTLSSLPVATY